MSDEALWRLQDSDRLYRVSAWGANYFSINEQGEIAINVHSNKGEHLSVSLMDMVRGMEAREISMPVLLRVQNLLENQINLLNQTFRKAIKEVDYQGEYRGVFPIKVNQQSQVIEDIIRFGAPYQHGLEAGSKAELMIALSMLPEPGPLIVCNGYKDEEFVELGLGMIKLGYKVIFVIETPTELPIIIRSSHKMGVKPLIGVRAKLFSRVSGHWNSTSGERSMFGLNSTQLVEVIDGLKDNGMLDCLQFLHYHLGSQIPNILDIRTGVREACRYYLELVHEGAPMRYLDLGGGLAVDYDGSRSSAVHSRNYGLEEYCADVVETIQSVLDKEGVPHPTIITESGRETVAYSSILLFNILDVSGFEAHKVPEALPEDAPEMLHNLFETYALLSPRTVQECFNDAVYYRDEAREQFMRGKVDLRTRAQVENIFLAIITEVQKYVNADPKVLSEPESINSLLSYIYYGNFSVFQSLPDSWAIDQVFPIAPLHRLNERPEYHAIIADLTCDSDGKIDLFPQDDEMKRVIPLHKLRDDEEYYLGIFLVGAYQETLGDLHNLLGDTHVVSVYINQDGTFDFVDEVEGDTVADVLNYVEYQPHNLLARFRETAERAVRSGQISPAERQRLVNAFDIGLRGYTYYER